MYADGYIFVKIVLPLSKAALAVTIGLFFAVAAIGREYFHYVIYI